MDDTFKDEEKLYRAVVPKDMYFKENGTLTSAAFKDSSGCSVDRGDNRTDEEAAIFMKKNLEGEIYRIQVSNCREKEIHIQYEPEEENPYHSALYKNSAKEKMTQGQCKHLASVAVLVASA